MSVCLDGDGERLEAVCLCMCVCASDARVHSGVT